MQQFNGRIVSKVFVRLATIANCQNVSLILGLQWLANNSQKRKGRREIVRPTDKLRLALRPNDPIRSALRCPS